MEVLISTLSGEGEEEEEWGRTEGGICCYEQKTAYGMLRRVVGREKCRRESDRGTGEGEG